MSWGQNHLENVFRLSPPSSLSLPSRAVRSIPLPPPLAPVQCLCCKQSFLPPFILVKSFQIYYAPTKLSVGLWLEGCPGFVVASCLLFFFQADTFICYLAEKTTQWYLYHISTNIMSLHWAELRRKKLFICNSMTVLADIFKPLNLMNNDCDPNSWVVHTVCGWVDLIEASAYVNISMIVCIYLQKCSEKKHHITPCFCFILSALKKSTNSKGKFCESKTETSSPWSS